MNPSSAGKPSWCTLMPMPTTAWRTRVTSAFNSVRMPQNFFLPKQQIVGPTDIGFERSDLAHRLTHRETRGQRKPEDIRRRDPRPQQDADVQAGAASRVPAMGSASASCGLLVGQINHPFRSAFLSLTHGQHIRGVNRREVANIAGKRRPGQCDVERRQIVIIFLGGGSHCANQETAGPSTALRSGRDDNSFARKHQLTQDSSLSSRK